MTHNRARQREGGRKEGRGEIVENKRTTADPPLNRGEMKTSIGRISHKELSLDRGHGDGALTKTINK